jgi:hypothetical protein
MTSKKLKHYKLYGGSKTVLPSLIFKSCNTENVVPLNPSVALISCNIFSHSRFFPVSLPFNRFDSSLWF